MFGRYKAFYATIKIGVCLWLKLNQSSGKEIWCIADKLDTRENCLKITFSTTGITLTKKIHRLVSRAKCISINPLTKRLVLRSCSLYGEGQYWLTGFLGKNIVPNPLNKLLPSGIPTEKKRTRVQSALLVQVGENRVRF